MSNASAKHPMFLAIEQAVYDDSPLSNDTLQEIDRAYLEDVVLVAELEDDGRWIAEAPDVAGVMVYGDTLTDALRAAADLRDAVLREREERRAREGDLA